ncbi:MAG: DNA topoisomerase, partial [Anaerovibrio sp.]|uniref:DNA topoisomerase n=1 Tax=Anaerovibrio sp. TaxID=1872532 RepID=UPI0026065C02
LYTYKKKAGDANNAGGTDNADGSDDDNNENSENNDNGENGDNGADGNALPPMKKNDGVQYLSGELGQSVTKPPSRFTQATLIAAMKDIHKFVQNPEAKKQLKAVYGIGTEATRATILDELIHKRKLLKETGKKKYLQPAQSAYMLIDAMPEELAYPDFTAIWEDRLHSMAEGEGSLDEFLQSQVDFTTSLCQKANCTSLAAEGQIRCPRCNIGILQKRHGKNGDFWGCSNYPRCRMSCDDKEGKPDFEGARRRQGVYGASASMGRRSAAQAAAGDDFDLGNPYMSEEEMEAFSREFLR